MSKKETARLSLVLFLLAALPGCAGGNTTTEAPQPVPVANAPAAPPAPRKSADIRAANPDELMGKTAQGLRALMGPPSLLRKDHGAEVWQYAGESCVLFAYLYPNAKGVPQVSYLDARKKTAGAVPVPACLAELKGTAPPTS